jgi:hypothetical protein
MSMKELEKMVRRAKGNWKEGCNDRNAAEYSIGVVNAAVEMLKQFDDMLGEGNRTQNLPLAKAVEELRDALYPSPKVEKENLGDEPTVKIAPKQAPEAVPQTGLESAAGAFVNPIDAMKKSLEDAA